MAAGLRSVSPAEQSSPDQTQKPPTRNLANRLFHLRPPDFYSFTDANLIFLCLTFSRLIVLVADSLS